MAQVQTTGRGSARGGAAAKATTVFELKSASLSLLALVLKTADAAELVASLDERLRDTPGMFNQDPLLVDLSQLERSQEAPLDLAAIVAVLREHEMQPVAVTGASEAEQGLARALGLANADAESLTVARDTGEARIETVIQEVEVIREVEVVREVMVPGESPKTLIIDKPLRSGQQVYAKGGDLVVMALVNPGAEVIADGNIHIYAPLRGKAIAGARGNTDARIFAVSMEAELVAIAGIYRTTENPLPDAVLGKPAQVRLEGEKLVLEALKL